MVLGRVDLDLVFNVSFLPGLKIILKLAFRGLKLAVYCALRQSRKIPTAPTLEKPGLK
jgi:hypothetical protein